MDEDHTEEKEVIKLIIINEDGTESEVDPETLNCIKLEISNSDDDEQLMEENEGNPTEESLLFKKIKLEVVEDPMEEFGEYMLSQSLEGYSEDEYSHEYVENEDSSIQKKRKRGRPTLFETNKKIHKCNICGYSSHQKSHYRRHLSIHSKPEGIFCSICKTEMPGKAELSEHMEEHRCSFDPDRYQCNLCDYSSRKLTNVSQHIEIHSKPEKTKFECMNCDFYTTNQTLFKKHLVVHKNTSRCTKCPVCLIPFKNMLARKKHLQRYKNGPEEGKYQCPECSYRTFKFNNFKQHMVVHRSDFEIEMFQCSHCPFKSKRKTDLRQHVIVKHKTDEEVVMFKCDFCSYESRRGNHLTSHIKNRHPRDAVVKKCGLCSYKTVSEVLIEKHCNIHSKVPKHYYLCSLCGEGFLSLKLLNGHKEIVHPFSEAIMDSNLSDDSNMPHTEDQDSDHSLDEGYSVELYEVVKDGDHTGVREVQTFYCCQFIQCNFQSTCERDAKIHKTICHNKRGDDNRCPECTFHTTSRYLYLDHLKVHKINIEHLKPHLCDICGTRWIRQGDLTRHMSIHWSAGGDKKKRSKTKMKHQDSDKELLQCAFCSYSTRLRLCLYKHMLKHGEEHQLNFNNYVKDEVSESFYQSDEVYEDEIEFYE